MKVEIVGTEKEIAALVLELQERRGINTKEEIKEIFKKFADKEQLAAQRIQKCY